MNKIKVLLSAIFIFITSFFLCGSSVVYAQGVNSYSDVFDDLRADENFKAEDYPSMTYDYFKQINEDTDTTNDQAMIEVIGIAESSDDELYIYTYQPLNYEIKATATAISISVGYSADGQDLQPKVYDLYEASSYGVFNKYVVEKFNVSDEPYRYYNFVAIYRDYIEGIDEVVSGGEADGSEYGIGVGQQWCAYYQNDTIVYEMGTFETMEIQITFTGNFEFSSGLTWGNVAGLFDYGHCWFVAFNVEDYVIKHIYDADMSYKQRSVRENWTMFVGSEYTYGEWSEDIPVTLRDTDTASYQGEGLWAKEYTWNRISSSADFIKNAEDQDINISDETKTQLEASQWVFAFAETELSSIQGEGHYTNTYTDIEDVTILRIHFIDIHDDVYNLGVVSDRVNPDNIADGNGSGIDTEAISEWFEKLIMLIGILILIVILGYLSPIFGVIFKAFITCIKWALKGIALIITAPFKMIGALFKRK